ncbi:unnamed protein product, partial [marine sediment metagenome]
MVSVRPNLQTRGGVELAHTLNGAIDCLDAAIHF